jgi:GTP cyclohydrolase III
MIAPVGGSSFIPPIDEKDNPIVDQIQTDLEMAHQGAYKGTTGKTPSPEDAVNLAINAQQLISKHPELFRSQES